MTSRTPHTKKPSHRLPPAEGMVPTPRRSTNMSMVLAPPDTDQEPDWRSLLDDPKVLAVIRCVARRQQNPRLRDDAESFLTIESVTIARRFLRLHGRPDSERQWYGFLHRALELRLKSQFERTYGEGRSAHINAAQSIEALAEILPGGIDALAAEPIPSGLDVDRMPYAIDVATHYPDGITAAQMAEELGISRLRAKNLLINGERKTGRFVRIRRGVYALGPRLGVAA